MNYKHSYHAGNFADVFKHCILIELLQQFFQKEKPITYLETHAGPGAYSLLSPEAQKTREYEQGVMKLADAKDMPETVQHYLKIVRVFSSLSADDAISEIQCYPGSPYIASKVLRAQDKMILCELQSSEYQKLKELFPHTKNISIHHQDGYVGLKAHLPSVNRRGLVFIDPPYEKPDEFSEIITGLKQAFERFETATYAVWYPIKNDQAYLQLIEKINKLRKETNDLRLIISNDKTSTKLIGCGIVVLNPPWQFQQKAQPLLSWLRSCLSVTI